MNEQLRKVCAFHKLIGEKLADTPVLLETDAQRDQALANSLRELISRTRSGQSACSDLMRRALMAIEELAEWIEAHLSGDLVSAADALGDRIYVLLGDAVETGLPIDKIFDAVHSSNMTKLCSDTVTGKAIKSENYQRPSLIEIIESVQNSDRDYGNSTTDS